MCLDLLLLMCVISTNNTTIHDRDHSDGHRLPLCVLNKNVACTKTNLASAAFLQPFPAMNLELVPNMDRKKTFLTKRIVLELSSVLAFLLLVNRPRPFSCFVYYGAFQTSSVITTSPAHKKRNVSWSASIALILFSKLALACTVQVCFLQVIYGYWTGKEVQAFHNHL